MNPLSYPEIMKDEAMSAGTDIVYRACYRACAGGPFRNPAPAPGGHAKIAVWDNDAIVNTASMLWPEGERVVLVAGDHMDIVGHYKCVRAPHGSTPGPGRAYEAYDLLKSDSGFDDGAFAKVWNRVFDFCV